VTQKKRYLLLHGRQLSYKRQSVAKLDCSSVVNIRLETRFLNLSGIWVRSDLPANIDNFVHNAKYLDFYCDHPEPITTPDVCIRSSSGWYTLSFAMSSTASLKILSFSTHLFKEIVSEGWQMRFHMIHTIRHIFFYSKLFIVIHCSKISQ